MTTKTRTKTAATNEPARPLPVVRGASSVGIDDLRANLRAYLARAQAGEWFAVIDMRKAGPTGERGLEVARFGPPEAVVEKMIGGEGEAVEVNGQGRAVIDALRRDGGRLYGRKYEGPKLGENEKAGIARELKKFARSKPVRCNHCLALVTLRENGTRPDHHVVGMTDASGAPQLCLGSGKRIRRDSL